MRSGLGRWAAKKFVRYQIKHHAMEDAFLSPESMEALIDVGSHINPYIPLTETRLERWSLGIHLTREDIARQVFDTQVEKALLQTLDVLHFDYKQDFLRCSVTLSGVELTLGHLAAGFVALESVVELGLKLTQRAQFVALKRVGEEDTYDLRRLKKVIEKLPAADVETMMSDLPAELRPLLRK